MTLFPKRAVSLAGALIIALVCLGTAPSRADLSEYTKKPDPTFSWKLKGKKADPRGTIYDLHLVSQVWEDIPWEHELQIYQPTGVHPAATMLLYNTGGNPREVPIMIGMELAKRIKAPVAFLYNIPNQPLFDGKKEDALIAETFVRYLKTKDENWPLLFPMVKSLLKAMDALEAFSKDEWQQPVKDFVISGGSKRGWTSWLTAASGDPRVKAIAPMVIDTLNMRLQLPHQLECFGAYSEMIHDYTERGLVPMPDSPEARRLWGMVDPWIYREKLTMPKFIINGNNDPYWSTDSLNLYWDDLKGDKWVLYVPNAGHNLVQTGKSGPDQFAYVLNGLAAFVRHQTISNPMPQLKWKHDEQRGKLRITAEATPAPAGARLWVAEAPTRDFRKAQWVEQPATIQAGKVVGLVDPPQSGFKAFYAEMDFAIDDLSHHLSTQIRIAGAK
jgi:PhoPQ-activated pathogenicity-related protein